MNVDIVKEYLVSLGFKVDTASFGQYTNAIGMSGKIVVDFVKSTIKNFLAAEAIVTGFLVAANAGLAKYIENLAKADLENEKLARRLWTTKENAMAYKNALDAMNATVEDLFLSPELQKNYFALRQQAMSMGPPEEYFQQMKFIRSIMYEFQRLKLEITYGMQWIGYYFIKYMEGPLGSIKEGLGDINDYLTKNMPHWTKNIALVLSWFARIAVAVGSLAIDVKNVFDNMETGTKIAAVALTGLFALIASGPIGWIIAGLAAILLLLDDYYTYKRGGESAFEGLWKEVDNFLQSDAFKLLDESVSDLVNSVIELGKEILIVLDELAQLAGFENFGDFLKKNILAALYTLLIFMKGIAGAIFTASKAIKGFIELIKTMLALFGKGKEIFSGALDKIPGGKGLLKGIMDAVPGLSSIWDLINPDKSGVFNQGYEGYLYGGGKGLGNTTIEKHDTYNIYGSNSAGIANAVSRKQEEFGLLLRHQRSSYA